MINFQKITLFWIALFMAGALNAQHSNDRKKGKQKPIYQLEEFHERDGLPNTFYKIAHQRQVKIAYIGGSITEAREGWRDLTFNWFRLNYPLTAFYQVNAAIGGTGSNLGVFRLERDVLVHNPDLVFVEFSVNDGGPKEKVLRSIEGIIRQIREHNPETDICFVYTAADMHVEDLVEGKLRESAVAMEELCTYYDIPSIHMGIEVGKLYVEGKLVLTADPSENANTIVFTRDHTHPLSESGHPIYAAVVTKYLEKMSKKPKQVTYYLSKPYVDDNWEMAKMIEVANTELIGNWTELSVDHELRERFGEFMPTIYEGKPGAVMRFRFQGKVLGFYDAIGPKTGIIDIIIDGQPQEKYRFDQWCNNYRKNSFFINDLEEGVHEVEIRVTDKTLDKAEILSKKKVTIQDPSRYDGTSWFPANVMIVGDLMDL